MHRQTRLALALAAALTGSFASASDYAILTRAELPTAIARGASVVEDYGATAWVRDSGMGADEEATFSLRLGERTFDARGDARANERAYGDGAALRLVQFDAPIRDAWLAQLRDEDVVPVQYVAPFAYVVWARNDALTRARSVPHVRWAGEFLPEYKTVLVNEALRAGEREWHVLAYRGAQLAAGDLAATGATVGARATIDRQLEVVGVVADSDTVARIAQLPGVYSVQPVARDGGLRAELANQITANNLGGNNLPVPGYAAWLAGLGLNGAGVTIANVDGGIFDTHPDLVARMLPCTGDTCGNAATDQHGTHTAGIMAGDASSGVNDANGFKRGLGMAPGARLVEQVYSPTFTQPGGMLKLMRQSHDNGAQLSGNSWGPAGSPRGYDADTRQVDVGTRDTKPDIAGDQPLTFVLSFMNGNGGTSSQGTPDEAKNVITVGSTKGQTGSGAVIPQFNDLSANTAHGPALDGRRIPHLVAPGCSIDSSASATGYALLCGTSMASPQVSGAVAVFIEKYRDQFASDPSAALIKAALLASSQDLFGNVDADGVTLAHRPDNKQGWGRLRADWLFSPADAVLYFDQDTRTFDASGESWEETVGPANASAGVRVVLSYSDAPGHGTGGSTPAWNNDLDLVVVANGVTYRGNVFDANGNSTSGGTADARNNSEAVVLDAATVAAAGSLDIRVLATNINSDALPNAGDATDQDFALVCVNCLQEPDYSVAIADNTQDVCTTTTTTASFPITVGSLLGYVDPVSFTLLGVPAGASGAVVPPTVTPPGATSVNLSQLDAAAPGTYTLTLNATSTSGPKSRALELGIADAQPLPALPTAPANGATNVAYRPTFAWAPAAQADEYTLEVATDAAFANIVFSRTTDTTSAQPTSDLPSGVRLYWRVRSMNACGASSATPTVFELVTLAAPGDCALDSSPAFAFQDSVESGTNGWTTSVGSGTAQWAISAARPYGGSGNAWLAQDVAVVSDQRLTSPPIVLPSGQNPVTLQFQSDQTIESRSGGCYDGAFVEVSVDGGTSFTQIPGSAMLTDPYNGPLTSGNPAGALQAWCGDPQAYLRSVVDLSAYAGQTVRLRFRLVSDSSAGRLPHGWYIDDIKVQSCAASGPPDLMFSHGFE